ncbi:MAG: FecCD family ABC transporter permease [Victivallaceae bacterium]
MARFSSTPSGKIAVLAVLALILVLAAGISLTVGELKHSLSQWQRILVSGEPRMDYLILTAIRLPRTVLGMLAGAALAVSGCILQSVMRNPLAAPGIIGVSAGAGLAGVTVMLALPQLSGLLVPAAFAGSLLSAGLIYSLAWKRGVSPVRLILAGVAVSAMLSAFSSAIMLFNAERAGGILDFTIGSLAAKSWRQVDLIVYYVLAGLAAALALGRKLNILALGDDLAAGLGMRVEPVRCAAIATAALLAAAAVSVAGLLGFVGLIAPHAARMLIGGDNRYAIPASALLGAVLVALCDTAGRLVMAPAELPVGSVMAMLGTPFFLWLLRRHKYES